MSDRSALALRIRPEVIVEAEPVAAPVRVYPGDGLSTALLASIAAQVVRYPFDVDAVFLKGAKRGHRKLAAARQYAIALVHIVSGRSQEEVAACFKRNRTTASSHMEKVESLHDVPEHEEFWELMERRYRLMVELTKLGNGRYQWLRAINAIAAAVHDGELEGEAFDQGRYIANTFWLERVGG